ncbi:hypothetical protein [Methylovirgula sp. 4M-Z18]|uniref:hypothetical protein n=1 Tax=Methylovirgula sp. 4M-Z18 TaxID=2293567 RepID=UPI000E2FE1AC|nr:hypothetical protein [Methylovirgula sp. 4M-Z18]RFB80384.1 hypothetical protein DYH55_02330 [Methylovirgula sp. 4M-Z18]
MSALTDLAATIVKLGAPVLGAALGGPAGALVPIALNALATALGTSPTADAINAAINANPTAAADAVKQAEAASATAVQAEQQRLADIENARATMAQLAATGSRISWGAPVISVLVVAGFVGLSVAMLFRAVPDSGVANVLFGALAGGFGTVLNFWLGSSSGSAQKSSDISSVLAQVIRATHK